MPQSQPNSSSLTNPRSSSSSLATPPTSSTKQTICQLCTTPTPAKYTCPRCHTRTCSLFCTTSHKTQTGCSATRNKAAYIPMNKYGWGSMVDDYRFLEDVGRRVGEWGREIVQGGFDMSMNVRGQGGVRGRGRGRVGRGARVAGRGTGGKREMLKMQLEVHGIEMELMPTGMERKKLNQSTWNFKRQTAFLTIQFRFHPSTEARSTSPFTLLTHRNNLSTPLLTLLQKHISDGLSRKSTTRRNTDGTSPANMYPSWVPPLVLPPPEDPDNFTVPHFIIAAPPDPLVLARSSALLAPGASNASSKLQLYHSLDPNEPLLQSLRGTQFIEFPQIEIWEKFAGILVDKKTGEVRRVGESVEPLRKRRKLDPEEGRRAIIGLVGQYGSDGDDCEEEGEKMDLVGYVDSEDDEAGRDDLVDEELVDESGEEDNQDDQFEVDPSVLLELVQRAQKEGKWLEGDEEDGGDFSGEEANTQV